MLTELAFDNFKAWQNLEIEFGNITGIFGTNSSGKSSILQLLLMLKQTRNARDRGLVLDFGGEGGLVNLGSFKEVVHGHSESKSIWWMLGWALPDPIKISGLTGDLGDDPIEGDEMYASSAVVLENERLEPSMLSYMLNGTKVAVNWERDVRGFEFSIIHRNIDVPILASQNPPKLSKPIKSYQFPDEVRKHYTNIRYLSDFEFEYEKLMDRIYYLGPLRDYPRREYRTYDSLRTTLGSRGEYAIEAIIAATSKGESRRLNIGGGRVPFQAVIGHWLMKLGLISRFRLREISRELGIHQVWVRKTPDSPEVLLTDVGFGVSQVLPVLVLLYYVPEGSIVLLEQPEIHLHPSAQSALADVILNVAQTRNVQVIVESHSEHLLRRIQRRVAEGTVDSDDVKIYFTSIVSIHVSSSRFMA